MSFFMMILVSLALSLDAHGIATNRGLTEGKFDAKKTALVGCWFGGVQFITILVGGLAGVGVRRFVDRNLGWVVLAFVLLMILVNAAREAFFEKKTEVAMEQQASSIPFLALICGVDGFLMGIGMALLKSGVWKLCFSTFNMWIGAFFAALVTFGMVMLGTFLGIKYQGKTRRWVLGVGAGVLFLMDLWFVLEHFDVLPIIL